jgi:hypothetical protein
MSVRVFITVDDKLLELPAVESTARLAEFVKRLGTIARLEHANLGKLGEFGIISADVEENAIPAIEALDEVISVRPVRRDVKPL